MADAGRDMHEGKEISWRDGFPALKRLLTTPVPLNSITR